MKKYGPELYISCFLILLLGAIAGITVGYTLVQQAERIMELEKRFNDVRRTSHHMIDTRRYHVFRINDIQKRTIDLSRRVKALEDQPVTQTNRAPPKERPKCSTSACKSVR